MASIRKHRGKWQVRVRRDGVAVTKSFIVRRDAEQWSREAELKAGRGDLLPDVRQLTKITLAELVIRYREEVTPRKKGAEMETIVLNAFLRHPICGKRLSDLTASDFSQYRDQRLRKVKANTLRRQLNPIQNMFNVARLRWGLPISINPVAALELRAGEDRRERRVDDAEWERLIAATDDARNPLIQPMMRLAKETGLRRSELLRITAKHVNLDRRELFVPPGKNNRARTVMLTREAIAVLSARIEQVGVSRVLFPMTIQAAKCGWRRVRTRAGLDGQDLRFHDMRHEAISRFFEMGLTMPEVASQSGHRDPRMLLRYGHAMRSNILAKLDR